MTFGDGFTFAGNQVHYDKLGHLVAIYVSLTMMTVVKERKKSGACADGSVKVTRQLQKAIDKASRRGGGRCASDHFPVWADFILK